MVEVTQEDRDAAAGCIPFLTVAFRLKMESGEVDENDAIQAFARHRQAGVQQGLDMAAGDAKAAIRAMLDGVEPVVTIDDPNDAPPIKLYSLDALKEALSDD